VSEERIRVIQQVVDALNDRDWESALEHFAVDFEYDLTRTVSPLQGV
jgi:hypothetical protein